MVRRRWLTLGSRVLRLLWNSPARTGDLVSHSYDRVAASYDEAWTLHMRGLSVALIERLAPRRGAVCLDLACGTGFVTREVAERTGAQAVGVDASAGMLAVARASGHPRCTFVQADAAEYLRNCPRHSVDVITCAWGLGYTRPWTIVREAARVLRPGGQLGIIDNTLFSLAGVLWASLLTFAEKPYALAHVMRVQFLPGAWYLTSLMRLAGISVVASWHGARTYCVPDGRAAIARLTATGAAAGFEFAAAAENREAVFARFAEVLQQRSQRVDGIAITHRYLAAVGQKP
jgi:ubiquinone/menaquinone biosynthesis C-methylase UbiE